MIRFFGPLVGTILVTLLSNNPAVAQNSVDCDAAVVANGSSLEVASDPGNDTENLQCALDKAVAENYTSVLMLDASYSIGSVTATEFSGLLSGKSSRATTVTIEAGAVDCAAPDPSALRFYVGAATVKGMTINVEELCGSTGNRQPLSGFTATPPTATPERLSATLTGSHARPGQRCIRCPYCHSNDQCRHL